MTDDTQTLAQRFITKYPYLWRLLVMSQPLPELSREEHAARMLLCGDLLLDMLNNMASIISAEEYAIKSLCDASAYRAPVTSYYPRL